MRVLVVTNTIPAPSSQPLAPYDIIHAHYAISGFVARLQFLYPVVVTYHGVEVLDHVPPWLRFLARQGPRRIIDVYNELCPPERRLETAVNETRVEVFI